MRDEVLEIPSDTSLRWSYGFRAGRWTGAQTAVDPKGGPVELPLVGSRLPSDYVHSLAADGRYLHAVGPQGVVSLDLGGDDPGRFVVRQGLSVRRGRPQQLPTVLEGGANTWVWSSESANWTPADDADVAPERSWVLDQGSRPGTPEPSRDGGFVLSWSRELGVEVQVLVQEPASGERHYRSLELGRRGWSVDHPQSALADGHAVTLASGEWLELHGAADLDLEQALFVELDGVEGWDRVVDVELEPGAARGEGLVSFRGVGEREERESLFDGSLGLQRLWWPHIELSRDELLGHWQLWERAEFDPDRGSNRSSGLVDGEGRGRAWSALHERFADDVIYDLTVLGEEILGSTEAGLVAWSWPQGR